MMCSRIFNGSIILSLLLWGSVSFAAHDGVGGSSASGGVDIHYNVGTDVSISGLQDVDFGENPEPGYDNRIDISACVYTNSQAGTYSITVLSSNRVDANNFQLSDGYGHYARYQIWYYPISNSGSGQAVLIPNNRLVERPMYSSSSTCENPQDKTATFSFRLVDSLPYPGSYSDSLTIQLDAE